MAVPMAVTTLTMATTAVPVAVTAVPAAIPARMAVVAVRTVLGPMSTLGCAWPEDGEPAGRPRLLDPDAHPQPDEGVVGDDMASLR